MNPPQQPIRQQFLQSYLRLWALLAALAVVLAYLWGQGPEGAFRWVLWVVSVVVFAGAAVAVWRLADRTLSRSVTDASPQPDHRNGPQIWHPRQAVPEAASSPRPRQRRRTLLSGISHQMGQPLTVLKGTLEMALIIEPTPDQFRTTLEEAQRQTERMVGLAGLLRELAAVEALRDTDNVVDFSLPVQELVEDMKPLAQARGVQLDLHCRANPAIRGELQPLRQTFMTLVDCLIRFTPAGGSIQLTVQEEDGTGCLDVSVRGTQLSPGRVAQMLRPFEPAHTRRGSLEEEQTLGMAFCQRVVEILGGHIQIDSEEDHLRKIRLSFPCADKALTQS